MPYKTLNILAITLCLCFQVIASGMFTTYDLRYEGRLISYHVEDINNDRLKDICIFTEKRNKLNQKERWLSFHFQKAAGFSEQASQSFRLQNNIMAFDFGDVAGNAEKEFVYFADNAVFYFSLADTLFSAQGQKLFEAQSLFLLPTNNSSVSFDFVRDVTGDQIAEILVPNFHYFDFYFRSNGDEEWQKNRIQLRAESKFSGFYNPRFSVGHRVNATYSIPYLLFEDFNADSLNDLIAVYADSLVVFAQTQSAHFSELPLTTVPIRFGEIWRGGKIQRTRWGDQSVKTSLMRLVDLNGDGLIDAVVVRKSTEKSIMNPETEVRIHFGKTENRRPNGKFHFSIEPDQVIKPDGTQLVLDVHDFNKDGRQDLLLPVVNVGLTNIVRMLLTKSVEIQAQTYLMDTDFTYPESPSQKNKLMISFDYRGGATSPVYELADFNGDGQNDILSSLNQTTLVFLWGKNQNGFESGVGAKRYVYLPQNGEQVNAMHLNTDGKADIIIHYDQSGSKKDFTQLLSVLLSNQ